MTNIRDTLGFEIEIPLPKGTQIAYVPFHIGGYEALSIPALWSYPSGIQPGFITSGPKHDGDYFCRYWVYDHRDNRYLPELRTLANSESTPVKCLYKIDIFEQLHVEWWINHLNL